MEEPVKFGQTIVISLVYQRDPRRHLKTYSATKRNEIGSFVMMWMDLESVIQIEVNQEEKEYQILTSNINIEY